MAYKFRVDEPVAIGVRRIALDQIQIARKQLSKSDDPVDAVHRSRKAFKRVRALLRLVRPALSSSDYRAANRRFRDLGRQLAQSRDLDVMVQTIDSFEVAHDLIDSKMTSSARVAIEQARSRAARDAPEPPVSAVLRELDRAHADFKKLDYSRCTFDVVAERLVSGTRELATHFKQARAAPSDDTVHEWRKHVQYHRRHMSLLVNAWPDVLLPRIVALKTLSEQLGRDQDLAVFAAFVASQSDKAISEDDAQTLVRLCRNEQCELRTDAFALGALMTAEKPKALSRRISAYWAVQSEHSIDLKLAAE